jgi:hypothetical protein
MDDLAQGYGAVAIFITCVICLMIARGMRNSTHWLQLQMILQKKRISSNLKSLHLHNGRIKNHNHRGWGLSNDGKNKFE